jgi:ABC-type transport system substrate-binding protein
MYSIAQGSLDYPISVELTDQSSAADKAQYEKEYAEWEAITLDNVLHYDLNVDEAIRLLEENGWTLNAQGGTYTPGVDEYRCKMIDGELVALNMTCAYPETNRTAVSMETLFIPYLEEAGIKLTLIPMDMKTLLRSYNDRDIEQIDMFYLGDDFNIEFDPQLFFLPGDPTAPEEDNLAWVHAQMYEYARLMCETDPHDTLGFMRKWVTFQEKFSDMLPMIPIYSNVYFDFYTKELLNYEIRKPVTWGDAIVPASMGLFVLEQEAAEAAAAAAGEGGAGSDDFETDDFE